MNATGLSHTLPQYAEAVCRHYLPRGVSPKLATVEAVCASMRPIPMQFAVTIPSALRTLPVAAG